MPLSDFSGAPPDAPAARLPKRWQTFRFQKRSWLVQLYSAQPLLHYEVWNLGDGRNRLEIGLHFESRDRGENEGLLRGFLARLFEIKAELGDSIEAEAWDKGWTKVYELLPRELFTLEYVDRVAARLAQISGVLQPIFEDVD